MNMLLKRVNRVVVLASPLVAAGLFLMGCGSGSTGVAQYYGNYHQAGWIQSHGGEAVQGVAACTKCHEISVIKVGSGIPGCTTSGCHHQSTPDWANPAIHGLSAKAASGARGGSLASCQICHAQDFSGGASASACITCHGVKAPHPVKPWRVSGGSAHSHTTTDPSNAAACAQCHSVGSPYNPAGHPATPAPAGTQPGCYNATLCHGANTASHPVPFLSGQTDAKGTGHMTTTAATFASDCATCHAMTGASPIAAAPLCSTCHTLADPTATASGTGTCLSCHAGTAGLPLGPGGTSFPNIAGAHAKHMGLATALTCSTCHAGSEAGTTTHYANANARVTTPVGPVPVVLDVTFKAKTGGNPGFNGAALTCSSVSCHGGQTTPSWQNGQINTAIDCTACHAIAATAGTTTQHNDAFGRHSLGTHDATQPANAITCTTCHDMTNGKPGALAHFKYLNTPAVDGVLSGIPADQMPSDTIVFDPALVTAASPYSVTAAGTAQGDGGCALSCHTHVHVGPTLDTWRSTGAPHQVPFLSTSPADTSGNGHMTATAAQFAADCATCHAVSGSSPQPGVPSCSVCHTLGDPTQASLGTGTCLSCHVGSNFSTAGPAGAAFPSIAGAHAKHLGLPTTLSCDTCHNGSGTGTETHYANANARTATPVPPATVAIVPAFNAQSGGTATFNPAALTCSSVSCHGGQTTPTWTGTLNTATQCSACHAINSGTTAMQYNDAVGRHDWGTHKAAANLDCTLCHDMTPGTSSGGANHFAELDTPAVSSTNKLPSGTVKFKLANSIYPITGLATYTITPTNVEGDGGCALTCHNQIHNPTDNHWNAAKGSGVAHPLPFYSTDVSTGGNHHQTVSLAQFNGECINCHDESGATSAKTGPTCTLCHTLGSPVAVGMGVGTCLSCHVGSSFSTQGPTGIAWPNLKGAHPKHLALATFTRTTPALPASMTASDYPACAACHAGSVPGDATNTHYGKASKTVPSPVIAGPAPVAVDVTFNAQSGIAGTVASASAFTCSNISCHGGVTTPGWQTGTLPTDAVDSTTNCRACHKITGTATQYNDATGTHNDNGTHRGASCRVCHDMSAANTKSGAVNHWKYLDTPAVIATSDQLSSDTVKFFVGSSSSTINGVYTDAGGSYTASTPIGNGNCTVNCHYPTNQNQNHTPERWTK